MLGSCSRIKEVSATGKPGHENVLLSKVGCELTVLRSHREDGQVKELMSSYASLPSTRISV
jgi:hypothetical protein